jgi:pyridoxamine 5'-phosphate oxidase-like protein
MAHINTAYFAWGDDLNCVWHSHPAAAHSQNLRANPSVAVAVYDSNQSWGNPIQLFGKAREPFIDEGNCCG